MEGVQRDPAWEDRTSATEKAPFLICLLYLKKNLVRNVRGMKTEDGYNLGNIDHPSSQFYCLHIR